MTQEEVKKIIQKVGLYIIYWKSGKGEAGGCSLASVGVMHNGDLWIAPCNWTSNVIGGTITTSWDLVESVVLVAYKEEDKVYLIPEATSPERERKLEQIREILRTI